jgi:pilus assembly protein CpaE
VVVFLHAKGGVGTTTIAVNVAAALAAGASSRVCLLDLHDLPGQTASLLGLAPAATLADAFAERPERLDEAAIDGLLVAHPAGLRLLVAGRHRTGEPEVAVSVLRRTAEHLRARFDYVVVDTDTGLFPQTKALLQLADLACVVTSATRPALDATGELLHQLLPAGVPVERQRVVVARAPAGFDAGRVSEVLDREPAAVVAGSDLHPALAERGELLVTVCAGEPAALELESLAASLRSALAAVPARA